VSMVSTVGTVSGDSTAHVVGAEPNEYGVW
jgi:hypothetical protein